MPFPFHLAEYPVIHIFDRPRTYLLRKDDFTLALAGFPFVRHGIRRDFLHRLDQTGRHLTDAAVRILCVHQLVDGATVGPAASTPSIRGTIGKIHYFNATNTGSEAIRKFIDYVKGLPNFKTTIDTTSRAGISISYKIAEK